MNYKSAFEALHGDLDHVMYLFVFVLEMIREDLDKLHVQAWLRLHVPCNPHLKLYPPSIFAHTALKVFPP